MALNIHDQIANELAAAEFMFKLSEDLSTPPGKIKWA